MEGKKKYFALIIFLFLGLMIFTFANPAEEEKEFQGGDSEQSEKVENKKEDTIEQADGQDTTQQEQIQQNVQQQQPGAQNAVTNNNQGNHQTEEEADTEQRVEAEDTSLEDAIAAVEKAEGTYSQDDVNAAKDLIDKVTDTTEKGNLEERLEEVEAGIAVLALLEDLEGQVKAAEQKNQITEAIEYRNVNEISNKIEALSNETVKEALQERLDEVNKLLDDESAPTTTIKNQVYGENIELTAEDAENNGVEMFLSKDNGEEVKVNAGDKTTSDGVYILRLVDEAFNEQTVTFTVDTTAPTLKALTNGGHYKEITLETEDKTKVTIEVTNKDKATTTEVEENSTLKEDATYEVTLTDEAGNTSTYELVIDNTKPAISTTDKSLINYNKWTEVTDKFLTNVTIKHVAPNGEETIKEFTRADFTVGENNENYKLRYKLDTDGVYTITGVDKVGNTKTETVTMDKTAPVAKTVGIYSVGTNNYKYVKNGEQVRVFVVFDEEVQLTDSFIANINGKERVFFRSSDKTKYEYIAQFTISKNETTMTEGKMTVSISGYKDKAGNKGKTITEVNHSKYNTLTYDRTAPAINFDGDEDTIYVEKNASLDGINLIANVNDNIDADKTLEAYKISFEHAHDNETLDVDNVDALSTAKEGTFKAYYETSDTAGNTAKKVLNVVVRDTREFKVLTNQVTYDATNGTALALIVTNKDLNTPITEGWTQGLSKLTVITKKFYYNTSNAGEVVKVKDLSGQEYEIKVVVTKINEIKHRKEIKLLEDTVLDEEIIIAEGQTKIIDLNGKTLTIKNPTSARKIKNSGTLIIKNGKIVNESIESYGVVDNYSTGNLTLSNVEVEDKGSYNGSAIKNRGGKVTITDSKFKIESSKGYYTANPSDADIGDGKYGNAAVYSEGTLTIKDCEITSDSERNYTLIIKSGTAEIENVNAKGNHGGLNIDGGQATVNEFKYESDVHYGIYIANNHASGTNVTINGGKFIGQLNGILLDNELNLGDINVTINGGEFISKTGKPALKVDKGTTTHAMNVTITGGTFKDTDVTDYIDKDVYRQDMSDWTVKAKSKIDSVSYLKEIAKVGGTYTLESDITLTDESIQVAKDIELIINTNGKKITGTYSEKKASNLIEVLPGAKLKLIGDGTISYTAQYPDSNYGYATNAIVNRGKLVIDGPTIINNNPTPGASYVIDNYAGSELIVESGNITQLGGDVAIRMFSSSATPAINVTINGGTISGYRAVWIQQAGSNTSVAPTMNLTVNGGTLKSTDTKYNDAIYSYSYGNSQGGTTVTFNGGTIDGNASFGGGKNKTVKENVIINGGTFTKEIGRYVPETEDPSGWVDIVY